MWIVFVMKISFHIHMQTKLISTRKSCFIHCTCSYSNSKNIGLFVSNISAYYKRNLKICYLNGKQHLWQGDEVINILNQHVLFYTISHFYSSRQSNEERVE